MNYYTFNDGITRKMQPTDLVRFQRDNNLTVVSYHSGYPATYKYTFSDGTEKQMTKKGARIYAAIHKVKIASGGPLGYSTNDFYEGFNPALGQYVSGKTEHNRILKERGLEEVGNETKAFNALEVDSTFNYTESDIKDAVDKGADISDNEAGALISGDL